MIWRLRVCESLARHRLLGTNNPQTTLVEILGNGWQCRPLPAAQAAEQVEQQHATDTQRAPPSTAQPGVCTCSQTEGALPQQLL